MINQKFPKPLFAMSAILTVLITVASLLGLFGSYAYAQETNNWLLQARGQDIGNLLAVVVLVASAMAARKGSQTGFLVWLGTLFYVFYAYTIYAVAVHLSSLFIVYVAIMGITFYSIVLSIAHGITQVQVKDSVKFPSYTLIATGILFSLLWLSELIPAMTSGTLPQSLKDAGLIVNPVHVLDLSIVLPGFLMTGYLALKNNKLGLFFIAPWLTFSVLMGSSIVAAMILMMTNGYTNTLPPMIMVSAVTILSAVALLKFVKTIEQTA